MTIQGRSVSRYLTDTRDEEAVKLAVEGNFIEFVAFIARSGGASRIHEGPQMQRIVTPSVARSVHNTIFRARLSEKNTAAQIKAALADYQKRQLPALWVIGPSSQPADLAERLEASGLMHVLDVPGMALRLADIPPEFPTPPGFSIARVGDLETLRAWGEASSAGFGHPGSPDAWAFEVYSRIGFDPGARLHNFIGWLDGEAVASATLFLGEQVAGMYSIATVPQARGLGIGSELTRVPLLFARDRGYSVGVLHSSQMGYRVYERVGFRACCTLRMFQFNPA